MLIKTKIKALHLRHPENGLPCEAEVIEDWFENGRFSGYQLRFSGESQTRHLRFSEIRQLQEDEENGRAA